MRKGAIRSIFIDFQIPDNCREKDNRTFDKKIALFGNPCLIEVEHDRIGRFISIGNIRHELGGDGIAAVAQTRIVEVDDIEFRRLGITFEMCTQVVVSDN